MPGEAELPLLDFNLDSCSPPEFPASAQKLTTSLSALTHPPGAAGPVAVPTQLSGGGGEGGAEDVQLSGIFPAVFSHFHVTVHQQSNRHVFVRHRLCCECTFRGWDSWAQAGGGDAHRRLGRHVCLSLCSSSRCPCTWALSLRLRLAERQVPTGRSPCHGCFIQIPNAL